MKNNALREGVTAIVLIALAILLLNPFQFWMPDMMVFALLAIALLALALFASFVLREQVEDERDGIHRMYAGRAAFLTGITVLLLGIVMQSFSHSVDIWLVTALIAMILAKLFTRIYSDRNY